VEGDRTLVISRSFNAPARLVFDAYTRADLVPRWWAPRKRGVTMVSCEADVRAGGGYRYVFKNSEGTVMAFSGAYSDVTAHTRLVYTQVFEPMKEAGAAIVTSTFSQEGDITHMVSREVYPSAEVRDGVLASGMEGGMRESMDQLDELVASLRAH
jgi:uncharacterized protein YndB with AHSA1/START domain